MNGEVLVGKFFNRPSLITDAGLAEWIGKTPQFLYGLAKRGGPRPEEEKANAAAGTAGAGREGEDFWGEPRPMPSMTVVDGVALVPIYGPIGKWTRLEKWFYDATDVGDVERELVEAERDPQVRGILLELDSPGGMVTGTPELADVIRNVEKPVYSFTGTWMASAAYWLGCAADGVFATRGAEVGSIGVYLRLLDYSKMFEDFGVKVELFKAGKFKGMGVPGTTLTDEQRNHLQEGVDEVYEMFTGHVRACRGEVLDSTMQGQCFMGSKAIGLNLVDYLVKGREDVIRQVF